MPAIALAGLAVVGIGPTAVLLPSLRDDARAAISPVVGAAILACTSPLLHAGVSVDVLGLALVAAGLVFALAVRRRVAPIVRAAAVPVAVAAVALLLLALPSAIRGTWEAASYGNGDPYLWVSQARSYLEGPPPQPSADFADRRPYELVENLHWPVALPLGVALIASIGGEDAAEVYGAFGVVVSLLLVLATLFAARGVLLWSRVRATAAALVVAANAYLLFSAFYGWQGQLALTAFGLLSVCCFRIALEREALVRTQLLAGIFSAAAIATYGPTYGPFAGLLAATAVGFVVAQGVSRAVLRRTLAVAAGVAGFTILAGAEPLLRAVLYLPDFLSFLDLDWLEQFGYAASLPADAIGLVPRMTTLRTPGTTWTLVAMIAALPVLAAGIVAAVRTRGPRYDLLVSTSLALIAALAILQLPSFSSYLSMKLASYGAPLLSMIVVLGCARINLSRPVRAAYLPALGLALALFGVSTAVSIAQGAKSVQSSTAIEGLGVAARDLPAGAVLVDVDEAWRQVWSVYYLRDRRVVLPQPTGFLTDFGTREHLADRPREHAYRLAIGRGRDALWRGEGLALTRSRIPSTPATPNATSVRLSRVAARPKPAGS